MYGNSKPSRHLKTLMLMLISRQHGKTYTESDVNICIDAVIAVPIVTIVVAFAAGQMKHLNPYWCRCNSCNNYNNNTDKATLLFFPWPACWLCDKCGHLCHDEMMRCLFKYFITGFILQDAPSAHRTRPSLRAYPTSQLEYCFW